ncbi:MAG: hypothetical protein JNL70_24490 [Saprospiraceae bacterium]|nr:hypothetical protein [Saprospiraceae bacterium]
MVLNLCYKVSVHILLIISLLGFCRCQLFECNKIQSKEIVFEVEMRQYYTDAPIRGKLAQIIAPEFKACPLSSDKTFFSDVNGNLKSRFNGIEGCCDCLNCSFEGYVIKAETDTLVCVNNFHPINTSNEKIKLLFKPYVTLALRLRSHYTDVEIVNVTALPASEFLRKSISRYQVKNHYFQFRQVDTTIYLPVLPDEKVLIQLSGRTASELFRLFETFSVDNKNVVERTYDF